MISEADRQRAVTLIDEAMAAGARQAAACAVLDITPRTLRRWRQQLAQTQRCADRRQAAAAQRTPANALSEAERAQILAICNRPEYRSLPPSQIVPRLADAGIYLASESSFYRVLRAADQQHHRGRSQAPREVPRPKGCRATGPNQLWSWDITYLATAVRGQFLRLYLIIDIYSRKIIAWEVYERETAAHAAALVQQACLREGIQNRDGLVLHSDNGAPMKGATLLATLQRLGVVPSFSRPAVSDDNPYSESLFRTLKYTPAWPGQPFADIAAARQWVHAFVQWYNTEHRHSAIRFVTPEQRHQGEDQAILAQRKALYAQARARHPQRWSGPTRNWNPIAEVWLNPPREIRARDQNKRETK